MAEDFMQPEDAAPELAQEPTQEPTQTPTTPPDYKAKRAKFIGKFAELDPEAQIDEPALAEILADKQKGPEFTSYVNKLNSDFTMSAEELAAELGYGEVKKKPGGVESSTGGVPAQGINLAKMQAQLGINRQNVDPQAPTVPDFPDRAFSTDTTDFTPTVPAGPAPGVAALPTAQEYPQYLRDHPEEREKLIEEEAKYLGAVPEGFERVRIPDEQQGPDAPGTYKSGNSPTGQRYIDRPLSKMVGDQEQSAWEAAAENLKNQLLDMGKGGLDYLGAADRRLRDSPLGQLADEIGDKAGLNGNPNRGNIFQDGADAIGRQKGEVAPFYAQSKFKPGSLSTYPMAASNVAALALPAMAAAILPEGKVAQGLQTMANLAFDSQMLEGSFARAQQAGLTPGSKEYDTYGLADGAATMVVFKLGGLGLGAAQQQAIKSQLVQDVTQQLRNVTGPISEQLVGKAMQKATQRVTQTLKGAAGEGAQMGTLMAANTIKDKVGERVANQQMGRAVFPQQSLGEDAADVGRSFGEGLALGGLTGGIRGAGQPIAPATDPRLRPIEGTKALSPDLTPRQAEGRTVLIRDEQGNTQLGKVAQVVDSPEGRSYVVRGGDGKQTTHPQGEVFTNDNERPGQRQEAPASLPQRLVDQMPVPSGLQALANAEVITTPARRNAPEPGRPAPTRATATDPGPTADNRPRRTTPRPADELTPQPTGGPTLGELVPDTTPVTLDFGGEPVQAFRNAEGDIELHHEAGDISIIDKGETFDKPALASLLSKPMARVKAGDTLTLGSGEFAAELPIEDLHRNQAGRITSVMVEGKTGRRIIEGDTPEGKAALAELNAREQSALGSAAATEPTPASATEPTKPTTPTFGTPAENRAVGKFTKDGVEYTRQEPIADRILPGKETAVHFASGVAQRAKFALVEADDLQPSHTGGRQNLNHFLPEAQPKNRSKAFDKASERAIADISERPDVAQLGESPNAYTGAPIINGRGEVIQGNGRAEGIRQHYRKGGKDYRKGVFAEAKRVGIDPTKAAKMKQPVLVRVADVSDAKARELGNYTAADTESGGTRRLDVKQAAGRLDADTRAELGQMLAPKGDATLAETIREKQQEVTRFLQKNGLATPTQIQTLIKADGTLTARGMEDVTALHRQLLFAEGDPNLPELFQELPAAAQSGLDRAVGALAGLPAADSIVPELQNAITGVREYKASGLDFKTWARQRDLFGQTGKETPAQRYSPLEIKLIELLADEKRPTYIAKVFSDYAAAVKGEGQSLFGSKPAMSRPDAIAQTFSVADATPQSTTRPTPANGRPTAPTARGMEGPAKDAQRGAEPTTANPEPAAGPTKQQLAEATRAKIQSNIDEAAERIRQRRAARRQEGKALSSLLGIGEIDPEDLRDALTIAKGHIKLGVLKTKGLLAKIREAGLSEDDAPTAALRPHLKKLLAKQTPAAKASKARRHATRYDEATREAFTQDEARYMPKTLIENEETAAKYIRQVGIENAYAVALNKPEGFSGAAHVEVQEAVAKEYRRLSDEARKAGKPEAAAEFWQKSKDVRAAKVSALTDAGQTLAQVQAFAADNPEAVLDLAIKETEKQRKPKLAKAEKDGAKVAGKVVRVRRNAMDAALKSETVRKVREKVAAENTDAPTTTAPEPEPKGYGMANKYFTKATALTAREALRKLGLSTIVPPELVQFVGYHVEALARAGGKNSFAEVSKRVVRELGAKAKPMLPEAYERARRVYVKNGGPDTGFSTAEEIAAHVAPAAVKAGIQQLGTTLDRIAREHAEGLGMKGRTLAERFTQEAGISSAQAKVYAEAVESEFNKQVSSRKSQLRAKVLTFSTRVLLGRNAATAVDKLLTTLNLASDPASAGELLKKQLNLPDITPEQADKFVKLSEAVRKARPGNDRSDRVQDLMSELGKLKSVSWGDAVESMWMANILSGPLTHAKNITANMHQAGAEGFISTLHTWAATGSLRAATGPALGAYRAQRRAFAEAAKIVSTGYTGTQSEKFGHNNFLENTTFRGAAAPLNGLKYVSRALVGADGYFNMGLRGLRSHELALKNAYADVKRQAYLDGEKLTRAQLYERAWSDALGSVYGLPDLRAAAESQADAESLTGSQRTRRVGELINEAIDKQQAKWASTAESEGLTGANKAQRIGELQELAQPAELVADAKRFAEENTFNNGFEGRLGAMGQLLGQLSDIPVGKARPFKVIVPFVRILTAVQNRRLDWTPWGMVRAAKGSIGPEQYQGGKFYRKYSDEEREKLFLKSTLGTVSALALYSMAKAGVLTITGTMFGDKDKEQQMPSSSIKWGESGLFTSFKDTPNEILLAAIGNTLTYDRKQEKAGKQPDTAKRIAVIAGLTSAYTLSMGPLKGLDDFNKNVLGMMQAPDRGVNYVAKLATNTAKGMVPYSALDQQLLQGLNILRGENVKETTSDNAWETAYNQLVQDVPVARNAMGDMVDILGAPIKASSTRLWGWMPERSEADQRGLDFLAAHELLPGRSRVTDEGLAGYDVKTGKVRPMRAEEFYTFQVARGQAFARQLQAAMLRPSQNPDLTPEQRALFIANPQADRALPDLPVGAARKRVAQMHKAAVAAGKRAVFTPHPAPSPN